jgi:TetR/AcrR family transcriptional regulator, cholesterol catabolism regulator
MSRPPLSPARLNARWAASDRSVDYARPMARSSTRHTERASTEARRPQILSVAAELFAAQGYRATSMDELAEALGLRKPSIYHHFPGGKAELLYLINLEVVDQFAELVASYAAEHPPEDVVRFLLHDIATLQREKPNELTVYLQEARALKELLQPARFRALKTREDKFRAILQEVIERGIKSGVLRAANTSAVVKGIIDIAASTSRLFQSSPELAARQIENLLSSLVVEPAGRDPRESGRDGRTGDADQERAGSAAIERLRSRLEPLDHEALISLLLSHAANDRGFAARLEHELDTARRGSDDVPHIR